MKSWVFLRSSLRTQKVNPFRAGMCFSAFMIAVTVFYFFPAAGIILGILGGIMAVSRVLGGVHFVKDVAVGAAVGVACGILGFYVV